VPVLEEDIVCRFVRSQDWSSRESRPRPGAFKQADLSVWHLEILQTQGVRVEDLRVEQLVGAGQAHHLVSDYLDLARSASEKAETPFAVRVEWRPEDEFVAEPWRPWRFAHVQVEATEGPAQFLPEYRWLLAVNSRYLVPPD